MARQSKNEREPVEALPGTGTSRVLGENGPSIPSPSVVVSATEPQVAVVKKSATDRAGQSTLCPPMDINLEQSRLSRLRDMARTNRDVAWLLNEYNSKTKKN